MGYPFIDSKEEMTLSRNAVRKLASKKRNAVVEEV